MRAATYSSTRPRSKGFQAFLASSACAASATSYHFCSAAPLPWPSAFSWAAHVFKAGRPFWPSGLTLRSSGLAFSQPLTLAVSPFIFPLYAGRYLFQRFACLKGFPSLFGLQRLCSKRHQLSFLQRCAASVAQRFSWAAPFFKSGRPLLAFGSNSALKRTGFQPAAYLGR